MYSQSGDDSLEDLTRFGYKINIKAIKKNPSILLAAYLRNYDDFPFKKFMRFMAIKLSKST